MTRRTILTRLGLAIADARVAKMWSQAQLAEAVQCSERQVSRWERGEQEIGSATLAMVCDALGVQVGAMLEMPRADT